MLLEFLIQSVLQEFRDSLARPAQLDSQGQQVPTEFPFLMSQLKLLVPQELLNHPGCTVLLDSLAP